MREIKFRAVYQNKLYEVTDIRWSDRTVTLWDEPTKNCLVVSLDDVTPLQFTGLHDKNGKEIYEGDVLKKKKDVQVWVVAYHEGAFWFCNPFEKDKSHAFFANRWTYDWLVNDIKEKWRFEVIGNIYENPELLK